jgi:hypothetical protein
VNTINETIIKEVVETFKVRSSE